MCCGLRVKSSYLPDVFYLRDAVNAAKPLLWAHILVERSNKFELIINLKTATALGVTIPNTLLVLADGDAGSPVRPVAIGAPSQ